MTTTRIFSLAVAALLSITVLPAKATLLVYEGFDIDPNSINGDSGVTSFGWSGSWTSAQNGHVVTGSLDYTDTEGNELCVVGNRVQETKGDPVYREFSPTYSTAGTLWYSLLANGNSQTHNSNIALLTTGGPSINLNFGLDSHNNPIWTLTADGQTATGAVQGDFNGLSPAEFLVFQINLSDSLNGDSIRFFENPLLTGTPDDGSALLTLTGLNLNAISGSYFTTIGNGLLRFDEIHLGTTYADVAPICCDGGDCGSVIPEPSAVALSMLGGALVLGFAARRRKLAA